MRLALLLFVVASVSAGAQDPVPDTTDWHRYYPLEVGNAWHYRTTYSPPVWPSYVYSHTIVRDTLVSDTTYYVVQRCSRVDGKPGSCLPDQYLIRYDEEFATVGQRHELPNGENFLGSWVQVPCGLDLPFDFSGVLDCFGLQDHVSVIGEYDFDVDIGGSPATGTFKAVGGLAGFASFLSGIGLTDVIPEGGSTDTRLVYGRVGGVEYGTPVVSNEVYVPPHQSDVRTYPNPARHEATFLFTLAVAQQVEASVYDLRGALLESRSFGMVGGGVEVRRTMDVSKWPSGLYNIRVVGDRGFSATKGIIVIH